MSDDVLRSFLVSLGFKVEENELRRMHQSLDGIAQRAAAMSAGYNLMLSGMVKAAREVIGVVQRAATELEQLHYAGQRVGGSPTGLQALGRAAANLGSSFSDANASIEGLAEKLRNLPGMEGTLNRLGIQTRDRAGHMRDIVAIQQDLGRRLNAMAPSLRHVYAGFYGQNEQFLRAEANPEWTATLQRERGIAGALGLTDRDVENATKFNTAIRDLGNQIESISQKASAQFFEQYGEQIKQVQQWLQEHSKEIIDALTHIGAALLKIAGELAPLLVKVDKFVESTIGWKAAIEGLAAVMLAQLFPALAILSARLIGLAAIQMPVWMLSMLGLPVAGGILAAGAIGAAEHATGVHPGSLPGETQNRGGFRNYLKRFIPSTRGGSTNLGKPGWWTPERQSHAVDYLTKNAGLTELGAKALVSRWAYVESPGGPTSENNLGGGHYGITQWSHSRGNSIWGNPDLDAQLALVAKELNSTESKAKTRLNAARTSAEAAAGAAAYERGEGWNGLVDNFVARTAAGIEKISGALKTQSSTSMFSAPPLGVSGNNTWNQSSIYNMAPSQSININVTGSSSTDVANAVSGGVEQQWGRLIRNLQTSVG